MKSSKFWIAVLAAGFAANVFDFIVQGNLLWKMFYANLPALYNQTGNPLWLTLTDFIAVAVFAWFYDVVYKSFEGGMKGGMKFGLYAGIFLNFPAWLFAHFLFNGFPYGLSWVLTIYGVIWGMVVGSIIGMMYKKETATNK